MSTGATIAALAVEVQQRVDARFASTPPDQAGLTNAREIVTDYLRAGEPKLALEHLLYAINENHLPLSADAARKLRVACEAMGCVCPAVEIDAETRRD